MFSNNTQTLIVNMRKRHSSLIINYLNFRHTSLCERILALTVSNCCQHPCFTSCCLLSMLERTTGYCRKAWRAMNQSFPKSRRIQLFSRIAGVRAILLYIFEKSRMIGSYMYELLIRLNPVCVPLAEGNSFLTRMKAHDGNTTTCMLSLSRHCQHQRINLR